MAHLLIETAVTQPPTVYTRIAGLDEAGRGALAGPVVAAAVILPLDNSDRLDALAEVNDSKQLSPKRREILYSRITQYAAAFAVGIVPAQTIDLIGIIPSTKQAMRTAVAQLTLPPDYLLIDGRIRLTTLNIPQQSIIRGDDQSLSIAAASIIAKVTRDRLMVALDSQYPQYGFAQHKGYGTEMHRQAIAEFGPCPRHRYSFAPIRRGLV